MLESVKESGYVSECNSTGELSLVSLEMIFSLVHPSSDSSPVHPSSDSSPVQSAYGLYRHQVG